MERCGAGVYKIHHPVVVLGRLQFQLHALRIEPGERPAATAMATLPSNPDPAFPAAVVQFVVVAVTDRRRRSEIDATKCQTAPRPPPQ